MQEGYTKKLYWGKWTHKAAISMGESDTAKPATEKAYKTALKKLKALVSTLGEAKFLETNVRNYPDTHWSYYSRTYTKAHTVTVYFKDAKVLDGLLESSVKDDITYVEKPYSEGHIEAMEVERLVVRKTLWWNQYRYSAKLKPLPRDQSFPYHTRKLCDEEQAIVDWIREQLECELHRVEGVDYKFNTSGYYQSHITMYFAHAQDAMLFRLAFGQYIKHNERIKLMSELRDAPQETVCEGE